MAKEFYLDEIGEKEYDHQVEATHRTKRKEYERNAVSNVPLLRKWGGEKPRDFSGKEVFVIGAGESLDENIDFLRKNQHQIPIISTDMSLRSLMVAGIKPKFCMTLETQVTNRFFDGLDTSGVHLMAYSLASNQILRTWKGSMAFFNLKGEYPYWLQKIYKRTVFTKLPYFSCGGNVFSGAFVYAANCNPKAIVLIGNDLGYKRHYYCNETFRGYQRQVASNRLNTVDGQDKEDIRSRKRDGKQMKVKNEHSGFDYYSDGPFLMVQKWMDEAIKKYNIKNVFCVSPMGIQNAQKGRLGC